MVEKPFAPTAKEAREVFELAKEKGLICMPNQNRRFDGDFMALKSVLESGKIGQMVRLESHYDYFREKGWYDTYGTLYNLAVHTYQYVRPDRLSPFYPARNKRKLYPAPGHP